MGIRHSRVSVILSGVCSILMLSGCVGGLPAMETVRNHPKESPIIYTSPVRNSATPLNGALSCYGGKLRKSNKRPLGIAIGDVKDYTGKQGQDEGFTLTQGGALMAYSALGKLNGGVRVHERFDTRVAEAELVYMNQRQLGDGSYHSVDDPATGAKSAVPWKPYYGGSIRQSDYFIVGGITELNYNIRTGGAEVSVSNIGPKARIYTMNIAVDLRIVGTQSLMVYDTVSVEKQVSGYEVGFGTFRFFGSELFDVNVGAKNQEPLQLGVRMAIEAAVLQLVASVAGIDPTDCVPPELGAPKWDPTHANAAQAAMEEMPYRAAQAAGAGGATVALAYGSQEEAVGLADDGGPQGQAVSVLADLADLDRVPVSDRLKAASGGELSIIFANGKSALDGTSAATLDRVASLVEAGRSVNLTLANRDEGRQADQNEEELRDARVMAVISALMRQGISRGQAKVLWEAGPAAGQFGSDAGGLQEMARLRIG